jgi:hypothetical protein
VLGDRVRAWIARLVEATRPDGPAAPPSVRKYVRYGASARAAISLALGEARGGAAQDLGGDAGHARVGHGREASR